jgi:hypothetical protein
VACGDQLNYDVVRKFITKTSNAGVACFVVEPDHRDDGTLVWAMPESPPVSHTQRERQQNGDGAKQCRQSGVKFRCRGRFFGLSWRFADAFDRSNKLISTSGKRSNVSRSNSVVVQGRTNLRDTKVQAPLKVNERLIAPYGSTQFLPGDYRACMLDEIAEYSRGLRLQSDEHALSPQFPSGGVELEQSETKAS